MLDADLLQRLVDLEEQAKDLTSRARSAEVGESDIDRFWDTFCLAFPDLSPWEEGALRSAFVSTDKQSSDSYESGWDAACEEKQVAIDELAMLLIRARNGEDIKDLLDNPHQEVQEALDALEESGYGT